MHYKLLLITLVAVTGCYGTSLSTFGNDFYVGFYEHVHTASVHQFFVHTLKSSSITFKVTSLDGAFSYTGTCSRNNPATVSIPFSYEVRDNTYSWREKGLRITSLETEPISVITWSYRTAADYMAYMAYPCHKQPTKDYVYYAMSSTGWSNQKGMFLLVGCHDDTTITINSKTSIVVPVDAQSSSSAQTIAAGQNYTLTLHSLQTFLVYVTYADLTATKIISSEPLTVISGHEAAQIPGGTYDADPTSTQLLPTVQWGKTFLLAPHTGRVAQFYRIMAYLDNTVVTRTCGTNSITTITISADSASDYFSTQGSTYCSIVSSKPINLVQIGASDSYQSGSYGDPCMNTVASMEQFTNTIQYTTLTASNHYYTVVMPNDDYFTGQILFDDNAQSKSWTSIYYQNGSIAGYGFSASASGSHTIAHPNENGKLFVSLFGWTRYGGYCYDSGMNMGPVNTLISLPQISFTQEEFLVKENNGTVSVYLERTKEFATDVTVSFAVVPSPADTATSGADYKVKSEVVAFDGNGATIQKVVVTILDDLLSETTEYFTITIEPLVGDVAYPINEAVIGIEDNDDVLECNVNNGGCGQNCTNTFEGSYCSCYVNYTLNANNQTCDPVCTNTCSNCLSCDSPGMCSCTQGWKGVDCCEDKDECDVNNGGCQQNCHNKDGDYYCSCDPGYLISDDHHNCTDVDECADGTNGCNQYCTNTYGSYLCYCNAGYELHDNQKSCEDTDECAVNMGGCMQTCTNQVGSYQCGCYDGYDLGVDQHSCVDINECDLTVACEHECYNTVGSFSCDCKVGYKLNDDGISCQDANECTDNIDGCEHVCVNEIGSYHCECNDGFQLDDDDHGCSDHNECLSDTHVCEQLCNNSHGAYTCSCKNGYRLATANNRTCDEIDECAEFISGCNQICQNSIGSYSCSCYDGFSLSNDQLTCEDVNECYYQNGGCELNCVNTIGSHYCSCANGYVLNDNYRCEDVNECQQNNGNCSATCTNTVGSYYCTCNTGFQLGDDALNCKDVDECQFRRCEHNCTNSYGSFYCTCDEGFELTDDLFCADIDECERGTSKCEQICFNRLSTYYCECNEGYNLGSDTYSCNDIDECAAGKDECEQFCNNTVGGYNCSCSDGYYLGRSGLDCLKNETLASTGAISSSITNSLPFIIPALIIIAILVVALILAIFFGRRKKANKTFKIPDEYSNSPASTTNPLYDEALQNMYEGGDRMSTTDTITESMMEYCDDEKQLMD